MAAAVRVIGVLGRSCLARRRAGGRGGGSVRRATCATRPSPSGSGQRSFSDDTCWCMFGVMPACVLLVAVAFLVFGGLKAANARPYDAVHLQPVPVALCCPRAAPGGGCQDAYEVVPGDTCRPLVNGTGAVVTVSLGNETQVAAIPWTAIVTSESKLMVACPKGVLQCWVQLSVKISGTAKLDKAWLKPPPTPDEVQYFTSAPLGSQVASYGYVPSPKCGWDVKLLQSYDAHTSFPGFATEWSVLPGVGAQLTVHDAQVDDSYNAMKLSISGRPVMPMLIILAPPSDAWDPFDMGVALVLVGVAVLSVGLTWAWFGCMELSFDIDKRERGLIPSDSSPRTPSDDRRLTTQTPRRCSESTHTDTGSPQARHDLEASA